jgi:hypothetical protein
MKDQSVTIILIVIMCICAFGVYLCFPRNYEVHDTRTDMLIEEMNLQIRELRYTGYVCYDGLPSYFDMTLNFWIPMEAYKENFNKCTQTEYNGGE